MRSKLRLVILFLLPFSFLVAKKSNEVVMPFSTDSVHLTIWNGNNYIPFSVKGINLSIAQPGTYPSDLKASREQYQRWFSEIKAAGFNCIRIYTLHFPHFYEELSKYNTNHPQHPLFFFQGIWLNENDEDYRNDLYQFSDTFANEIRENIDCIHGKKLIEKRFGKAYGNYNIDVSPWNIGYIIGREVLPEEVLTTNKNNSTENSFSGNVFQISEASPTEVWFTKHLETLVEYEKTRYDTQRPVSISSWACLDPIQHPEETNRMEDTVSLDFSKIKRINAPAGFFISYHAYPYYPDFISRSAKNPHNSYLTYINQLKTHYYKTPLLIAEFGIPSSWGVAHYSNDGVNYGGFDESQQGEANSNLFKSILNSNLAGGLHFAWIDEWYKKTWITKPVDFGEMSLWHNITAAEQNFGLKKFVSKNNLSDWEVFEPTKSIQKISAAANYDFFEFQIDLKSKINFKTDCWIGLDTYDANLGESTLPNGQQLATRCEFALKISKDTAYLYVTEAYDLFGLWYWPTEANQKHQSIISDGKSWQLERWRNSDNSTDIQLVGKIKVNSGQEQSSKDAIIISDNKILVKLPWTLLHFTDPSKKLVLHDDKTSPELETQVSDGIAISIFYNDEKYYCTKRFIWHNWYKVPESNVTEEFKSSYWSMKQLLYNYNSPVFARDDFYEKNNRKHCFKIPKRAGVISNDFDLDSDSLFCTITDKPLYGKIRFNADGSFIYTPNRGFKGTDFFTYTLKDGQNSVDTAKVDLIITKKRFL